LDFGNRATLVELVEIKRRERERERERERCEGNDVREWEGEGRGWLHDFFPFYKNIIFDSTAVISHTYIINGVS